MARYIDADELYETVTKKYSDIVAGCYPYNIVAYDMARLVKEAPTADVVSRSEVKMLEAEIRGYSVALKYDAEHFTADIKKLQLENATLIKNRDMLLQNYAMKIFDGLDKIFADYGLEYFNSNLKRQIDEFKKNITGGE